MTGCVESRHYLDSDGYGRRKFRGRLWHAHRVAWIEANGEIPEGMQVLHRCDNRACINPAHLYLGTHADNMADKVARGRQSRLSGEQHGRAKLTQAQADEIRRRYAEGNVLQRELAQEYGVSRSTVSHIVTRRKWRENKYQQGG